MKKRKKYLLLILLLILPVVFYSLSYVKVSKSLGSIETPEILDEYDENNNLAANAKLTLKIRLSTEANKNKRADLVKPYEASCTPASGKKECTVEGLQSLYKITDDNYEFDFWASSVDCKEKPSNVYSKKATISKSTTYYVCLKKKGSSSSSGNSSSASDQNKKAYITQTVKTNSHTLTKCDTVYVKTCQGNSQGAICSYNYNGDDGTGLSTKYFSYTLPAGCTGGDYKFTASFKNTNTSAGTINKNYETCRGGLSGCSFSSFPTTKANTGYRFIGWSYKSDCKTTTSNRKIDGNTTFYACWEKTGSGQDQKPTEKVTQKPTQKPTQSSSSKTQEEIPTEDVPTKDTDKEDVYKKFIVVKDDGNLICGDKIMVTKCTKGSNNKICDVTFVNDYKLETQINYKYLVDSYDQVPEACLDRTMYTTKGVPMYTKVSEIGKSVSSTIPCGSKIVITNMGARCSNGPGKNYCEAKYNNTQTVFVDKASLADAKPDSCDGSGSGSTSGEMCVYNSSKNDYKWIKREDASKNSASGYKETDIVNENDCKDSSESEKSCTTSSKATDVTELKKLINICYEKKNDKITNDTDINSMYSCASDYTKNPVKLNEDTCKNIKDGTCHKSYVVSCASAKRPGIEIAASLLNQGVGTITIRGRKVAADVKSYYLDEQKVPSNDSLWKDFSDTNTVAYEQKPAGLYYAWVRDVNGIISRPMYAVVHDADINNTLKSLSVSDADDISLTLKAIGGTTANTDEIMPSNYALLSNRLNTDSTLAGFDSLSMGYEIDVNSSKISVYATLTSDDAKYVEGYEPRTVDLDYGRNTILIKIQSNSGKVRTYTIIANRTDDRVNNNLLSDLTVSKGKISFDPYVTNYDIEVGKNVKSVNINANLASDTSAFVTGFTPRKVDLNNDITTAIIKTISETGSTRSYVLTFKKTLEDEGGVDDSALLDTLFIRGTTLGFNREVFDYSVTVPYEYEYTEVYAFPESDNASVEVTGNTGLRVGANNVEIKVTNKRKINIYNVTVIRREPGIDISNDITLSSLNVKGYKIDFKPDVLDYQVKIKREKSLIITATPTSNRSDIYMYGNNNLTGFSTVRIKVVAENGNTNIYSIDIQKDSYNKVLEVTATVIGCVIFLGAAIIVVVRKKHKKMKEYLGK